VKIATAPVSKQNSQEFFDRAVERLEKLFSFDVAALVRVDASPSGAATEVWVERNIDGKKVCKHKILQRRLNGDFRQSGDHVLVVSGNKMASDVGFINQVAGIAPRALKSGLLIPLPAGAGVSLSIFLGSYSNKLLQARRTVPLAKIHTLLTNASTDFSASTAGMRSTKSPDGSSQDMRHTQRFASIELPAAQLDDNLLILKVNPHFEKAFGYSRQQVERRRNLRDLISPAERRQVFRHRENRSTLRREAIFVLRNGTEKHFDVTLQRQAHSPRRIAVFRDISTMRESAAELRQRAERLAVIQSVAEAVNAATSVDEIFAQLVKQLRGIVDFNYASLAFHHPTSQAVHLEAVYEDGHLNLGTSEMPLRKFRQHLGAQTGVQEKFPEAVLRFLGVKQPASIAALVLRGNIQDAARQKKSRSRPAAVGCLILASDQPGAFSSFHKQVLDSVGDLLGAGIRKVQLWRQAQENYERFSLLSKASRDLGQSLELEQVLRNVVDVAKKILRARAAAICLINEKGKCGQAVAGLPELEREWPGFDLQTVLAKAKPGEIISISDIRRSKLFSNPGRTFLIENHLHAFLGAAILIDQKPAGLMGVFAEEAVTLRGSAVSIFSALVAQTARVLQNARLFEEVSETKNYLESLVKSSVDAIVSTDRLGRITYFSPGAERMLGFSANEVLGRPMSSFAYHQDDGRRLFKQAMREQKVQSYECDVLHADGGKVPASLSLSQIRNDSGRLTGFLAIGKDVSARVAAEQESRRRGEELENYIYLISHNLKTPIVSIQGFVNLFFEELGASLSQQNAHYLERIQKNAAMMERMIADLFDFSRMARPQPALSLTSIREIVNDVVNEMRHLGHMREIEFDIAPDLPEVIADREGMHIAFENLISNAVKYRRPGVPTKIKVGWESLPRFFAFYVQDNGMGFDPGFKEKAFTLFQRGPNTSQIPGTGVGLALVKRIIENHRGLVRIESTLHLGTTVHFTIPRG